MRSSIICFVVLATFCWPQELRKREDDRLAVERAWERVIAAKGGRSRLYSIKTFAVSSPGKTYGLTLIEFPSKYWSRDLLPRAGVGHTEALSIVKLNGETGEGWFFDTNGLYRKFSRTSDKDFDQLLKTQICYIAAYHLLETKWYKPDLIAVDEGRWNGKAVQVIFVKSCFDESSSITGGMSAYVIDFKTHLPLAFCILLPNEIQKEKICGTREEIGTTIFSNYEQVDGLMLSRGKDRNISFQINPTIPPNFFSKEPTSSEWGIWDPSFPDTEKQSPH
jgi:hypothetical protein